MNSAVYQIQKISNGKSEDIFLHLDELKKNSIKFSKVYTFEINSINC